MASSSAPTGIGAMSVQDGEMVEWHGTATIFAHNNSNFPTSLFELDSGPVKGQKRVPIMIVPYNNDAIHPLIREMGLAGSALYFISIMVASACKGGTVWGSFRLSISRNGQHNSGSNGHIKLEKFCLPAAACFNCPVTTNCFSHPDFSEPQEP